MTWWRAPHAGGYEVFFSRDELRTRGSATPPAVAQRRGVAYLAPADADHGGAWLLVNARGVSLGLINHYPPGPAPRETPPLSRGQLLLEFADVPSAAAVADRLAAAPLRRCPGFYLLAFDLDEEPRRWRWDTRVLHDESKLEPWPFLTASSFQGVEIAAHRRALFVRDWAERHRLAPADLAQFHLHREPARPAWGILMDRPDARTVSFSHLSVGPRDEAVFSYSPRPAADGAPSGAPIVARLPLVRP
ncbi:MAG: NRDE family protein [Opitutales bacterium]